MRVKKGGFLGACNLSFSLLLSITTTRSTGLPQKKRKGKKPSHHHITMASHPTSILLTGGTLLLHDEATNHITPARTDLLIEGPYITRIASSIDPSPTTKIIDCTHKLVCPGFINTHAHLWQTQLKGRHSAHTLVEYMPSGNYIGSHYTPADLFWGQLGGALENVDAGTTTVLDHSHLNLGKEYPRAALKALRTSGLRAVYGYTPPRKTVSWEPLQFDEGDGDSGDLEEWRGLVKGLKQDDDDDGNRVSMGYAMDNLFMPTDKLQAFYAAVRADGARVITSHATGGPAFGGRPYAVGILHGAGVLGRDVVLSHAPCLSDDDVRVLAAAGAGVSSTPNTEMQMGMEPVAMRRDVLEGKIGSLGVDCHSWGSCFLPLQMNLCLQERRLGRAREVAGQEGKRWVRRVEGTVEEVFNLGTLGGARAVGMEGALGSLREGYRADVVIFDATSPAMLAAAVEDPVAAVVLHSSIRDVRAVIIDGIVRKEGGRLCDVRVEEALEGLGGGQKEEDGGVVEAGTTLSWVKVANEVLKSRRALDARIRDVDFKPAEEAVIDMWHMNRDNMVER